MPFTINDSYTFLLVDVLTNQVLTELPMTSVSFTCLLNGAGPFSSSIPVVAETTISSIDDVTTPGLRGIIILRNGAPIYGGIIWKRSYQRNERRVQIEGSSWESWFGRRLLKRLLTYGQVDQLDIFRDLVFQARNEGWNGFLAIDPVTNPARPDTNFALNVPTHDSGVLRDRTYYGYDGATYGDRMKQLSAVLEGFDWRIRNDRVGNGFERNLLLGYPYLGATEANTSLVFEYPGNLVDYTTSEDSGEAATSVVVMGAGDGSAKIMVESTQAWSGMFSTAGWPLLESVQQAQGVTVMSTMNEHLGKWERKLMPPMRVVEATARGYTVPEVGSYEPGDYAMFRIQDDFTNTIITEMQRIYSFSVTVPDSATEETVSFVLVDPETERAPDVPPEVV
jgi:hypothetical protein